MSGPKSTPNPTHMETTSPYAGSVCFFWSRAQIDWDNIDRTMLLWRRHERTGKKKNAHTYICIHASSLSHHPSMQQSSSIIHHPSIHASSMLHHPSSMHHPPVIVQRPSSIHRGSSMTHGWCWSWGEGFVWRGGLEMINNNMRIQQRCRATKTR